MADLVCCSTPKKMKLESDCVDDSSNEAATDLSTYVTNLKPVLADEYTNSVQFETAIACEVRNKKYLSHIIKELSVHLPVPKLQHLKRVKKTQRSTGHSLSVFLCPLDEKLTSEHSCDNSSQMPSLRELCPAIDLPDDAVGETFTVLVPSHAPLTRQQYEEASAVWPTTFHEDKHISRILSGNVLNNEELNEAELNMKTAIRMAEAGRHLQQKCMGCSDGCAIVDPLSKTLLAAAHPVTNQHPLHHSIMVAIDLIARQQGGGSYKYEGAELYVTETRQSFIQNMQSGPYLCTGYDVYVTTEPCIMCSMALIHSRIRRLYYGNSSPDGALGTKYKLHVQPALNHHFEVFRGLLEKKTK